MKHKNFWIRDGAHKSQCRREGTRETLSRLTMISQKSELLALLENRPRRREFIPCVRAKLPSRSKLRRRLVSRISMLIVMGDLTSSVCAFHFPTRHALAWHTDSDGCMNDGGKWSRLRQESSTVLFAIAQNWKVEEIESTDERSDESANFYFIRKIQIPIFSI